MRCVALLLTIGLLGGCGGRKGTSNPTEPGVSPRPHTPATSTPRTRTRPAPTNQPSAKALDLPLGRVVSVQSALRFVVVDFGLGGIPSAGSRLGVYRQGLKVGVLRISGKPMESNTIGDIIEGDAFIGDEVRAD